MKASAKISRLMIPTILLPVFLATLAMPDSEAGELDLPDQQNAKMARLKAEGRVLKNKDQKDYIDTDDTGNPGQLEAECGAVNIGNVVSKRGFGVPREINVIIDGDVINSNNNCR